MASRYQHTPLPSEAGPGGEGLTPEQSERLSRSEVLLLWNSSTLSYPARPAVPAGMVKFKGPVRPTTWLDGDDWSPTV